MGTMCEKEINALHRCTAFGAFVRCSLSRYEVPVHRDCCSAAQTRSRRCPRGILLLLLQSHQT